MLSADDSKAPSVENQDENSQSESNASLSKSKRFILFKSKSFLTVRNETGSFFLCQAVNSIYEDSKKSKIQWLEEIKPGENKYKYGYVDWVDPFAIIARVNVNRIADSNYFAIEEEDLKKVNNLLEIALKDGGITVEFDSADEESNEKEKKLSEEILANSEVYDKEEDDNEEEMSKKSKRKKEDNDSDFKPDEKDIEEAKKEAKVKISKSQIEIEAKSLKQTSPIIASAKTKSKSSIEIKKLSHSPQNQNKNKSPEKVLTFYSLLGKNTVFIWSIFGFLKKTNCISLFKICTK